MVNQKTEPQEVLKSVFEYFLSIWNYSTTLTHTHLQNLVWGPQKMHLLQEFLTDKMDYARTLSLNDYFRF